MPSTATSSASRSTPSSQDQRAVAARAQPRRSAGPLLVDHWTSRLGPCLWWVRAQLVGPEPTPPPRRPPSPGVGTALPAISRPPLRAGPRLRLRSRHGLVGPGPPSGRRAHGTQFGSMSAGRFTVALWSARARWGDDGLYAMLIVRGSRTPNRVARHQLSAKVRAGSSTSATARYSSQAEVDRIRRCRRMPRRRCRRRHRGIATPGRSRDGPRRNDRRVDEDDPPARARRRAFRRGLDVMVTNPVDVVTYASSRSPGSLRTGFAGLVLDSSRLRSSRRRVASRSPMSHAYMIGEHGDLEFRSGRRRRSAASDHRVGSAPAAPVPCAGRGRRRTVSALHTK